MKARSVNPTNGKLIEEFESSTPSDVADAVSQARRVYEDTWSRSSVKQRTALVRNLSKIIVQQTDSLLDLLLLEIGKPRDTASFEIDDILAGIEYFSSKLERLEMDEFPVDLSSYPQTEVHLPLVPHGVVAVISPWNFPFWTPMTNIVPAVMAGNTIVFKPDEHTTLMGMAIRDLFNQAGFPKGVLNLVIGDRKTGQTLVGSSVDKIAFTGSTSAGNDVVQRAGIKPVLLELGGNDAAIVCEDAILEQAVPAICWGAVYNAGQACNGIKRVYVVTDVAQEFIDRALEHVALLKRGRDYGPIIDAPARATIVRRVQRAVRDGAQLKLGGSVPRGPGFWLDPIVLVYEQDDLELICQETFGPVIPIRVVSDTHEAIALANRSGYGLGANVWTRDMSKGREIAGRLEAKMVCVNEALFGLPGGEYWGGWRNSGLGTTESRLLAFLKRRILIEYSGAIPRSWWSPAM